MAMRHDAVGPGLWSMVVLAMTAAIPSPSPASSAAAAGAEAAGGRRPSVLLILPDQWRGQDLGCMGNPEVRTPHLDRLASQGVLFRNTFANTPVCCPARANLLTGKYAHRNGMVANDLRLRESETTLAEILAAQGYRTGFIGKWHLDGGKRLPGFVPPGPRRQGFAFWAANECGHRHFRPTYFRDDDRPDHRGAVRARGLDRPGHRVPASRPGTTRSSWSSRWGRPTTPTGPPSGS